MIHPRISQFGVLLILSAYACERGNASDGNEALGTNSAAISAANNSSSCPVSGGDMARMAEGFCIDRTEVTQIAYAAWLASKPTTTSQPSYCGWNTDFKPTCAFSPESTPDKPVVCVDWCDAAAFCKAAGKRLCGGVNKTDEDTSPLRSATSEWQIACRKGTPAHNGSACQGWQSEPHATRRVATGLCTSNDSVHDLIGNVWEWADSCTQRKGSYEECRVHGGSFVSADVYLDCDVGAGHKRKNKEEDLGFRCCAD